jgi:16S rRNA (cytidine1402-2'-O)-methyltransferase
MADRGRLTVCATPIGNLGDITARVARALRESDAVLCEDTRVTRRLLSHLGLDTPLERCDENVIRSRADSLVARIAAGERLALVSDAGTPAICDPGAVLVAAVRDAGLPVEVLPGPSAVLAALTASGFQGQSFYFGGFMPRKAPLRRQLLARLADLQSILVFFESPHRTRASLEAIAEACHGRQVCLARELTKMHEEVLIGTADDLAGILDQRDAAGQPLRGEVVLLVAAPQKPGPHRHVDKYEESPDDNTNQG